VLRVWLSRACSYGSVGGTPRIVPCGTDLPGAVGVGLCLGLLQATWEACGGVTTGGTDQLGCWPIQTRAKELWKTLAKGVVLSLVFDNQTPT